MLKINISPSPSSSEEGRKIGFVIKNSNGK